MYTPDRLSGEPAPVTGSVRGTTGSSPPAASHTTRPQRRAGCRCARRLRQSWEGVYARGAGGNHPHRAARPAVLLGPGRRNPAPTTRNSDNKDSSEEPARGPGPLQRGVEAGLTDGRRRRRYHPPRAAGCRSRRSRSSTHPPDPGTHLSAPAPSGPVLATSVAGNTSGGKMPSQESRSAWALSSTCGLARLCYLSLHRRPISATPPRWPCWVRSWRIWHCWWGITKP